MKRITVFPLIILVLLSCNLPKYTLTLNLTTNIDGADIYVNDVHVAKTPLDKPKKIGIFISPEIDVQISIRKDFYNDYNFTYNPRTNNPKYEIYKDCELKPGINSYPGLFSKNDYRIPILDLFRMNEQDLLRLETEIKARYGAPITNADIKYYFEKQDWYKENSNYSDDLLSSGDLINLSMIRDTMLPEDAIPLIDYLEKGNSTFTGEGLNLLIVGAEFCADQEELKQPRGFGPFGGTTIYYQNADYELQKEWLMHYYLYKRFIIMSDRYYGTSIAHINDLNQIDRIEKNVEFDSDEFKKIKYNPAILSNFWESSYYDEEFDNNAFHPIKTLDKREETPWATKPKGVNEEDYIGFYFRQKIYVDEIRIMGGYFDSRYFQQYNRVKKANISFSHYSNFEEERTDFDLEIELEDSMTEQKFTFPEQLFTSFSLQILEIYESEDSKSGSTAISEISFYHKGKKININLGKFSEYLNVLPY